MSRIDTVTMAILSARLDGVARKMANTLLRTGRSGILTIARDFSCCILTGRDQLIAMAESLPIHVLSGPDVMARTMRENHPVLQRGDAFLHNSPYHGCTHPADHSILIPVIDDDAAAWMDDSEERMRSAIRKRAAGTVSRTSWHDPMPNTPPEGIPIKASVTVDPAAETITVDRRDNPDCLPVGLNLSEACARSAALIGVFNSIDPGVPKNAGASRRLNVQWREGCICGIPRHPTSCSVATTNIADHVANAVQAALAELQDGIGLAEAGLVRLPSIGVVSGNDPRTGQDLVNEVYLGITGGAGAPACDGWLSIVHLGNAGLCFQDSVELDEVRQPIFVESRRLIPDSEGAGRFRGALGCEAIFGPTEAPICIAYVSDGNHHPPQGTRGGLPGGAAAQYLQDALGRRELLANAGEVWLEPGQMIVSVSTGGGGYGEPATRDPDRVLHDVREGWITPARAREVDRVAIVDGRLDPVETDRLRGG